MYSWSTCITIYRDVRSLGTFIALVSLSIEWFYHFIGLLDVCTLQNEHTARPFLCLSLSLLTHIQTIDNYLSICRFTYCINASFFFFKYESNNQRHTSIYIHFNSETCYSHIVCADWIWTPTWCDKANKNDQRQASVKFVRFVCHSKFVKYLMDFESDLIATSCCAGATDAELKTGRCGKYCKSHINDDGKLLTLPAFGKCVENSWALVRNNWIGIESGQWWNWPRINRSDLKQLIEVFVLGIHVSVSWIDRYGF